MLATTVLAGCTPTGAPTAAPVATPAPAPASPGATACDAGAFPGWPRPGQVTSSGIVPILASSEKVVGQGRLVFVLVDQQNRPIVDETLEVEIGFYDLCSDPASATEVLRAAFEWGLVGQRAFYVVTPELTHAGPWGAAVAVRDPATGGTTRARLQLSVSGGGSGPRVGDTAPPVRTLTLADVDGDVGRVSTDPSPDPTFYETSLDAALAMGEPVLLAFITPAFCTGAPCGPTIEAVKDAVAATPIRVVAVEPYELVYEDGRLQPVLEDGSYVPVEAAATYGIPTDPWLFVVDADGTISASFETVIGVPELEEAIRAVSPDTP